MKNKLLALLLMVALVCTALFVVACQPEEEPEYTWPIDISKFWAGHEDEETYTIVSGTGGGTGLKISYEKTATWQYAKRSFAYEDAEQLAQAKTLVLEGKMVTDTNDPFVTLKIEYTDNTNKEVHFYMSDTNAVYEWDLSEAHLEDALLLYIFAEGNRVSANGTIELSRIQLTNEAIHDENNIEKQKTPVEDIQVNTITADTKTVNAGWYDTGDGVYTIEKSNTAYNVAYNKAGFSWGSFYALVKGDALSTMKTFSITVKGTAGKEIMVKPFDKVEAKFTLTGGEDVINVDLTKVSDVDFTAEQKVFVFAEPNVTDVSGSFQIINAEFSTEQVVPAKEVNAITAAAKTVNVGWYDGGDNVYTIDKDGTAYNVSYEKKSGHNYSNMYALVKGDAISTMKTFKITLKGTEGKTIIVKPFDKVEKTFTFTGNEDTFIVDISGVTGVDFAAESKIILMVEGGAENVLGSFQIISAEFSTDAETVEPDPTPAEDVITWVEGAELDVNKLWRDAGDSKWTIAEVEGVQELSYPANVSWSAVITKANLKTATFNTLVMTVKGSAGAYAIFKVESEQGNFEQKYETTPLTGEEQTFTLQLGSGVTGNITIRIFGDFEDGAEAGKIVIKSAKLYKVSTVDSIASSLVNANATGRFTIAGNKLSYTTSGWDTAVGYINLDGINTIAVKVKGISGHTAILKIGNIEQKFESSSPNGFLNGEEQVVTFDVSGLSGIQEFRVFADWDAWTDIETVSGELTIVSVMKVVSIEDAASSLANAQSTGRFTIDGNKLTYTTASWDTAVCYVNVDGVNTITLKVKGLSGHTAILKIGNIEQKFESSSTNGFLNGEEQTVTFDVSGLSGIQEFRVFADWDAWTDIETVPGELTIVSITAE